MNRYFAHQHFHKISYLQSATVRHQQVTWIFRAACQGKRTAMPYCTQTCLTSGHKNSSIQDVMHHHSGPVHCRLTLVDLALIMQCCNGCLSVGAIFGPPAGCALHAQCPVDPGQSVSHAHTNQVLSYSGKNFAASDMAARLQSREHLVYCINHNGFWLHM